MMSQMNENAVGTWLAVASAVFGIGVGLIVRSIQRYRGGA